MKGTIERRIAALLRAGMLVAMIAMCVGGVSYLAAHGSDTVRLAGRQSDFGGEGLGLMKAGIIILIATPIVRVAFSVGAFACARDRTYVLINAAVLAILLYSVLGGR
jgi:uncharacterized membrane protein